MLNQAHGPFVGHGFHAPAIVCNRNPRFRTWYRGCRKLGVLGVLNKIKLVEAWNLILPEVESWGVRVLVQARAAQAVSMPYMPSMPSMPSSPCKDAHMYFYDTTV